MTLQRLLLHLPNARLATAICRAGVKLAWRQRARLLAITVVDTGRMESLAATAESAAYVTVAQGRLDRVEKDQAAIRTKFSQTCQQEGVSFEVQTRRGLTARVLQRESEFHDLIVTGWEEARGSEKPENRGSLLGSSAEILAVASGGAHPLLILRDDRPSFQRVLLAYDGSVSAGRAIRSFLQHGLAADREVRLLGVAREAHHARQNLHEMAEYCGAHGVHPESGYVAGALSRFLGRYATQWEADLVVLGARPVSRLWHLKRGDLLRQMLMGTDAAVYLG